MHQHDLLTRDALATAAAVYLAETSAPDSWPSTVNFPAESAAETSILDTLTRLGYIDAGHGYIEPGCVEHGVIHVCHSRETDDPAQAMHWIEIDPVTGNVCEF